MRSEMGNLGEELRQRGLRICFELLKEVEEQKKWPVLERAHILNSLARSIASLEGAKQK